MPYRQPDVVAYSRCMADSFAHWTGRTLLETAPPSDEELSFQLYHATFALASHDVQHDPVLNYGNLSAQLVWGFSWTEFTAMPSRLVSEPEFVEERRQLIENTRTHGHVDHYQSIRLSRSGRRFLIRDAFIWNVMDREQTACIGQAAVFSKWDWL